MTMALQLTLPLTDSLPSVTCKKEGDSRRGDQDVGQQYGADRVSNLLFLVFVVACRSFCRYLTGFTLFLSLILNRTFFMILDLLKSEEKMEVIKKQVCFFSTDPWREDRSLKSQMPKSFPFPLFSFLFFFLFLIDIFFNNRPPSRARSTSACWSPSQT